MFLTGKLKDSPTITAAFTAATKHLQKSGNLGLWIAGMFNIEQASYPWNGWERDMSYCQLCWTRFLEDHVWVWYFNEGAVAGGGLLVRLRTMVYNQKHAAAKNHICTPMRGDVKP